MTHRLRFADCTLDTGAHRLTVAGEERNVEPQVFDLLVLLARNPGRLVSRDELVETVWRGRIVSESAIAARINAARRAVGDDGQAQRIISTVPRRGIRLAVPVTLEDAPEAGPRRLAQTVRFCRSADGTRIAFATMGSGPPLVRAGHWLTHLEHDFASPIWRPLLERLARSFTLVRYDQRGNGLSDWTTPAAGLDVYLQDLEAVVDAAGLTTFALYGTSQGVPLAIAYAARHPGRVTRLVLHGGYARGRSVRSGAEEEGAAWQTLVREGWGRESSALMRVVATAYVPGAGPAELAHMCELQRLTASPENAVRLRAAADALDVSSELARVRAPTLVLHARGDAVHPLSEGRDLAATIPDARFVELATDNHVLLPAEPAFDAALSAIERFALDEDGSRPHHPID